MEETQFKYVFQLRVVVRNISVKTVIIMFQAAAQRHVNSIVSSVGKSSVGAKQFVHFKPSLWQTQ